MDDADIARAELDHYFHSELVRARTALTEAKQRMEAWRTSGESSRRDVIAAWKLTAARALATAQDGQDPSPHLEHVEALHRWALAQNYWSENDDLPAEVEVALRKALRTTQV